MMWRGYPAVIRCSSGTLSLDAFPFGPPLPAHAQTRAEMERGVNELLARQQQQHWSAHASADSVRMPSLVSPLISLASHNAAPHVVTNASPLRPANLLDAPRPLTPPPHEGPLRMPRRVPASTRLC